MRYIITLLLVVSLNIHADTVEIYKLQHRDKVDIIPILNEIKAEETVIQGFQNQIIINGSKADVKKLKALLANLDVKQHQFIIKVAIGNHALADDNTITTTRSKDSKITSIRFVEGSYINVIKRETKLVVTQVGYIENLTDSIRKQVLTKTEGILLTANLINDNKVNIKIKTKHKEQMVSTTIEAPLSEWIEIFSETSTQVKADNFYSTQARDSGDISVFLTLVD